jgi:hypothetical protein
MENGFLGNLIMNKMKAWWWVLLEWQSPGFELESRE